MQARIALAPDLDRSAVDAFFLEALAGLVQFIQRSERAYPDTVIGVLVIDGNLLNAGLHAHHGQLGSETVRLGAIAEGPDLQVIGAIWSGFGR